MLVTF
jgi:hypothetical protein